MLVTTALVHAFYLAVFLKVLCWFIHTKINLKLQLKAVQLLKKKYIKKLLILSYYFQTKISYIQYVPPTYSAGTTFSKYEYKCRNR